MKQRASAPRKKEYIVVFYDMDTDQEKGRTKTSELMTYKQAQNFVRWAYKLAIFSNAYGVPVKVENKGE